MYGATFRKTWTKTTILETQNKEDFPVLAQNKDEKKKSLFLDELDVLLPHPSIWLRWETISTKSSFLFTV